MSALYAVHAAIYSTLSADATLAGLSLTEGTDTVAVVNAEAPGSKFPYVFISKPIETPWNVLGGSSAGIGFKVMARTHIYSRYAGDKEADLIHARIVALLNKWNDGPAVSGFETAIWEYEQGKLLIEPKDKIETRHLIGEFKVLVR